MRHPLCFFLMVAVLSNIIMMTPLLIAGAEEPNTVKIDLQAATEDNKKIILATVSSSEKPLVNATVNFFVERSFGNLDIGHDVTLDDGTAAVPFPVDLPGGTEGRLHIIAIISNPPQYSSIRGEAMFDGAKKISVQEEVFPRALWAPQAPLGLIITIAALLTVVWGTYVFVVAELIKIRKEGVT